MIVPTRAEPGEGKDEWRNPNTTYEIYILPSYLPAPEMRTGAKIPASMGKQVYESIRGLQGTSVINDNIQKPIFFIRDGFTKSLLGKHVNADQLHIMANIKEITKRGIFTRRVTFDKTSRKTEHVRNIIYLTTPVLMGRDIRLVRLTVRESYREKLTLYDVTAGKYEGPLQLLPRESGDSHTVGDSPSCITLCVIGENVKQEYFGIQFQKA